MNFSDNLNEMLGELFLPTDTPEAPKQSFFKNLFSGGPSTLDREELCKYAWKKNSKNKQIFIRLNSYDVKLFMPNVFLCSAKLLQSSLMKMQSITESYC